jgi:hypothetical protein
MFFANLVSFIAIIAFNQGAPQLVDVGNARPLISRALLSSAKRIL